MGFRLKAHPTIHDVQALVAAISTPTAYEAANTRGIPGAPRNDVASGSLLKVAVSILAEGSGVEQGLQPKEQDYWHTFVLAAETAQRAPCVTSPALLALVNDLPLGFLPRCLASLAAFQRNRSILQNTRYFSSGLLQFVTAENELATTSGVGDVIDLSCEPWPALTTVFAAFDVSFLSYTRAAANNALAVLSTYIDVRYAAELDRLVVDLHPICDRFVRVANVICHQAHQVSNLNSFTVQQRGMDLATLARDSASFDTVLRHLDTNRFIIEAPARAMIETMAVQHLHVNFGASEVTAPHWHAALQKRLVTSALLDALRETEDLRSACAAPVRPPLLTPTKLPTNDLRLGLNANRALRQGLNANPGKALDLNPKAPQAPKPPKIWEEVPPDPSSYVMANVVFNDGSAADAPLCGNCFAISRYNKRAASWHTALNCRSPKRAAAAAAADRLADPPDPPRLRHPPAARAMGAAARVMGAAAGPVGDVDEIEVAHSAGMNNMFAYSCVSCPPVIPRSGSRLSVTPHISPTASLVAPSLAPCAPTLLEFPSAGSCASVAFPISYAQAASHALPTRPRTALDSGCAPLHLIHPASQDGPSFPARTQVLGALNVRSTFSSLCEGHVDTCAVHPATQRLVDVRIKIPGMSLSQDPLDTELLSLSTLLRHGWRVDLNKNVAFTRSGFRITLERRDGLWLLPLPRGAAGPVRQQHVLLDDSPRLPQSGPSYLEFVSSAPPVQRPASVAPLLPTFTQDRPCEAPDDDAVSLLGDDVDFAQDPDPVACARLADPIPRPSVTFAAEPSVKLIPLLGWRSCSAHRAFALRRSPRFAASPPPTNRASSPSPPQRPAPVSVRRISPPPSRRSPRIAALPSTAPLPSSPAVSMPHSPTPTPALPRPSRPSLPSSCVAPTPVALVPSTPATQVPVPSPSPASCAESSLDKNMRLWTAIHLQGHPKPARMRLLAQAMQADDPNRPALCTLRKWIALHRCGPCLQGAPIHPARSAVFPPRPRDETTPGSVIHLDGTGDYPDSVRQADGTTSGVTMTDRASNHVAFHSLTDRTSPTIIALLQRYQATTGTPLLKIITDPEFYTSEIQAWCDRNGTQLVVAAPRAQHQNSLAERTVDRLKSRGRVVRIAAALHERHLSSCLAYAAEALNRTPSSCDPLKLHRSPNQIWASHPPYSHTSLQLHPLGSRVFAHVGKTTENPNVGERAHPGVYMGHDQQSCAHRVLCLDSNKISSHAVVHCDPARFPLRELLLAGEIEANQDFNPDKWRTNAPLKLSEAPDADLSEFLVGKQITLTLPTSLWPNAEHASWRVLCHAPVTTTAGPQRAMNCRFVAYQGDLRRLPPHEQVHARNPTSLFMTIPISKPDATSNKLPSTWDLRADLRSIIAANFPLCVTLADVANVHKVLYGASTPAALCDEPAVTVQATVSRSFLTRVVSTGVPRSRPSRTPPRPAPAPTSPTPSTRSIPRLEHLPCLAPLPERPVDRIIVPVRTAAGRRAPEAAWSRDKHHLLPARKQMVVTPRSTSASRPVAVPTMFALMPNKTTTHLGFEPRTVAEAKRHPSWPLWNLAMVSELDGLIKRGTWDAVHISSVPKGTKIMRTKWVLKDKKLTGPKARLTARGDLGPDENADDVFASTPTATEVRLLLSTAHQLNHAIHKLDVSQSFVQSNALRESHKYYIYPPPEAHAPPGTVWRLNKPLYGVSIAPAAWGETIRAFLADYGFTAVNYSDSYFVMTDAHGCTLQLVLHTDDVLVSFPTTASGRAFKTALLHRFDATDEGPVEHLLGCSVSRDVTHLHLSQEQYADEVLERFGMTDCNPSATPMDPNTRLLASDRPSAVDPVRRQRYQEITGCLQFLATWTRPDLTFVANQLGKHCSNPGEPHMQVALKSLRYLKGTKHLGITYTRGLPDSNRVLVWTDADWASDTETRRSLSAWVATLNGGAVSWKSKQAPRVASSTTEAEFVAASKSSDEALWLRRCMEDIGLPQKTATPLFCDNRAVRMMSENPVHRERSKFVDFRMHRLKEHVADGVVRVIDCPTRDMLADTLTKQLPGPDHSRHTRVQLGLDSHTSPSPPASFAPRNITVPALARAV